jgi:hypothetical protein
VNDLNRVVHAALPVTVQVKMPDGMIWEFEAILDKMEQRIDYRGVDVENVYARVTFSGEAVSDVREVGSWKAVPATEVRRQFNF